MRANKVRLKFYRIILVFPERRWETVFHIVDYICIFGHLLREQCRHYGFDEELSVATKWLITSTGFSKRGTLRLITKFPMANVRFAGSELGPAEIDTRCD